MKLCRFGKSGSEKPAVLVDRGGKPVRLDVSAFGEDYGEQFFGSNGVKRLETWLASHASRCPEVEDSERVAPPITRPSKIICVGLNYADHAKETGSEVPKEPMLFGKSTTAMCGAFDDIVIPRGGEKTDWEVELAIVIGATARYVDLTSAANHVAGYCVMNDVSERAFQKERGGQFIKGKSADTFAPFGPFLVTPDESGPMNNVRLWLELNGQRVQDGSSADMIFEALSLVSYISHFMTLLPGDVISTGTPSGVGAGMKPVRFLMAGDVIEYGVDGLGRCRNRVV